MTALWTPPGADLGEHTGPEPDHRMVNFLGGLDANGQPLAMTYQRLRARADIWPTTAATPEGPARLLKAARDMFALGYYSYELVACSCSWSLFAVEAALKLRLQASQGKSLAQLIATAQSQDLIDAYLADILDAGRKIRNNFVHEGVQPLWTFGMAYGVIGASFKVVANLFPDTGVGAPPQGQPE